MAAGKATSPVKVNAPGGAQTVVWDTTVLLRGSARIEDAGVFLL
jgi:hypothetical protein